MSRSDVEMSICCDGEDCGEVLYYYGPDFGSDAICIFLIERGWRTDDLCPKCVKKEVES